MLQIYGCLACRVAEQIKLQTRRLKDPGSIIRWNRHWYAMRAKPEYTALICCRLTRRQNVYDRENMAMLFIHQIPNNLSAFTAIEIGLLDSSRKGSHHGARQARSSCTPVRLLISCVLVLYHPMHVWHYGLFSEPITTLRVCPTDNLKSLQ